MACPKMHLPLLSGILTIDDDGMIVSTGEGYYLEDFGGVLPGVGDLIVDPGVVEGRDRREPSNRQIMEVEKRYFQPRTDMNEFIWTHLVVPDKAGRRTRTVRCLPGLEWTTFSRNWHLLGKG